MVLYHYNLLAASFISSIGSWIGVDTPYVRLFIQDTTTNNLTQRDQLFGLEFSR